MASLIRLKQIESGSSLEQAAEVGSDFSGAVYQIIDGAGLFSSSAQVDLVNASNYDGFVVQLDMTMSSDLERNILSASISQSVSILSQTYVTTASLNTLSSSLANTDSQSLYLISLLSSSVQATSGDFSSSVASQFSSSYATIYSISSSTETTINNLSSSIATSLSASEAAQLELSGAISTTITNLSSSFDTTINNLSSSIDTTINNLSSSFDTTITNISSSISTDLINLSSSIDTTINNLSSSIATSFSASEANIVSISSSIYTSISSSDATFAAFSSSIDDTILNKMNVVGVISSSTQLDGSTLKGITIAPINSDGYSLIVSGAVAVVNATGLPDGGFGDTDSTVPAQIWLDGNQTNTTSVPPIDPSTDNQPNSNQIDMGEF